MEEVAAQRRDQVQNAPKHRLEGIDFVVGYPAPVVTAKGKVTGRMTHSAIRLAPASQLNTGVRSGDTLPCYWLDNLPQPQKQRMLDNYAKVACDKKEAKKAGMRLPMDPYTGILKLGREDGDADGKRDRIMSPFGKIVKDKARTSPRWKAVLESLESRGVEEASSSSQQPGRSQDQPGAGGEVESTAEAGKRQ